MDNNIELDYSSLPKESLAYLGMLDENGNIIKEESTATQVTPAEPRENMGLVNPADSKPKNMEKKNRIRDNEDIKKSKLMKIKEKIKKDNTHKISSLKHKAMESVDLEKQDNTNLQIKTSSSSSCPKLNSVYDLVKDWRLLKDEGFEVELSDEDEEVEEITIFDEMGNEFIIRKYPDCIFKFETILSHPVDSYSGHFVDFIDESISKDEDLIKDIKNKILYFIQDCLNFESEPDLYTEADDDEIEKNKEEIKPKKIKKESKFRVPRFKFSSKICKR